jgi:hypothetical protein
MMTRSRGWIYLAVFAVCALLGGFVISLGRATIDNIHCRSRYYSADDFLAYCRSNTYGDYEHGALYYGVERTVRDRIRNAQVLFLGSSRTQAGFSTKAVKTYFGKFGIQFFLLAFGYGEWSAFPLAILKRWKASPKVLVIIADPFFSDNLSVPAQEALDGRPAFFWRLALKFLFQRVHRVLCFSVPLVCSESEPAIFRSARDGQWNWIGPYIAERAVPVDHTTQKTITPEELEIARDFGEKFLHEIGLDRRCVVLTATPISNVDSVGMAQKLAAALQTNSIFPSIEGLSTVDGGHLNLESAERWSGEFLEALTPILQTCIPAVSGRLPP